MKHFDVKKKILAEIMSMADQASLDPLKAIHDKKHPKVEVEIDSIGDPMEEANEPADEAKKELKDGEEPMDEETKRKLMELYASLKG